MISLERPQVAHIESYFEFIEEMRQHGEKIWEGFVPVSDATSAQFVRRLLRAETQPAAGLVSETIYWACEGSHVVGRIALRHTLTESLKEFGGHIGYEVRPSCRKRGVAKEMLRLLLQTSKAQGIGTLLLTCAPDNLASNKTILANGGQLFKKAFVETWQRDTNYYWIHLPR